MKPRSGPQRRYHPSSPFQAPPEPVVEKYDNGDRVTHDEYGLGRVVAVDEGTVTVDFGAQRVRLASPFRKLAKL
jgi:hypothetical protein